MVDISYISSDIRTRIASLLRERGASIRSISRDAAEIRRLTYQINNSDKAITAATVVRILEVFPDVSSRWLLFGDCDKISQRSNPTPLINNDIDIEGGMYDNSSVNSGASQSLESEVTFLRNLVQQLMAK